MLTIWQILNINLKVTFFFFPWIHIFWLFIICICLSTSLCGNRHHLSACITLFCILYINIRAGIHASLWQIFPSVTEGHKLCFDTHCEPHSTFGKEIPQWITEVISAPTSMKVNKYGSKQALKCSHSVPWFLWGSHVNTEETYWLCLSGRSCCWGSQKWGII